MPWPAASADAVRASSKEAPPSRADLRASRPGSRASIIVLSPGSALPRASTPFFPAPGAGRPVVGAKLALAGWGRAHLQEKRPVEGPASAADGGHERHAHRLQQRA